ncbi:MAG: hypothetical protein E7666_02965 [Ruminococcaceae bacterium]|nr:hypothetical protein [Oscillospiraceae bacterium]
MISFWKGEHGGKGWLLILLALIGVGLLIFGGIWEKEETERPADHATNVEETLRAYQTELETRIREICASTAGVSDVRVIVTLASGFEAVYATELIDGDERYVILGNGSNAEALLLSHAAPKITGIGVICRGGGNATVRRELIALLSAAFDLPTNRIYITEAKP